MEDQAPNQASVESMDIDQDSSQNTQPNYMRRNYGSRRVCINHPPSVAQPTTIDELFEEFKAFSLLKKKDDMASNIEVGTESFVLSRNWLKKYCNFILFDQFRAETTQPTDVFLSPTHF